MPRQPALRDALRIKPGSRVTLAKLDPNAVYGHDKASSVARTARQMTRLRDLQDRIWAEQKHPDPRRAPGHRRRRQGRDHRQGHGRLRPAGLPGHIVQGPECGGARARLPVARPPADAGQGRDRHLQPLALRGRARRPGPRSRPEERLVEALRPDQRLRADARRERHDHRQVLPQHRPRRAAPAHPGPLRRSHEALEVQARRPRGTQALGRLPGRLQRRADQDFDAWAPWYVIPANRNWFRNLAVSTILADTLAGLKPAYPEPADLPADLVIE